MALSRFNPKSLPLTSTQKSANLVNVRFQKKGNWEKVGMIIRAIEVKEYRREFTKSMREVAEAYKKAIQDWIIHPGASVPLVALSPVTIAIKEADGSLHPEDPWLDTEWLLKHLQVYEEGASAKNKQWLVGYKQGMRHPSGLDAATLCRWLEYGTRKMTPRPLFRLTYARLIVEFQHKLEEGQNKVARYMQF